MLLFLTKSHIKQDADKRFNVLKQDTNSEDIWTADKLDTMLTKNVQHIDLMQVERNNGGSGEGLNNYYQQDSMYGLTLVNHKFVFGDNTMPTKYKRKEYCDSTTVEKFDLIPTYQ